MPSGVVDLKGLPPSSFFSEEVCFPNEVVFCKSATMTDPFGSKIDRILRKAGSSSVAQSPLEMQMPLDSQIANGFDLLDCYLTGDQKFNFSFERHMIGGQRAINHSSPRPTDYDANSRSNMESPSLFSEDSKINVVGPQYENGLFSSSLSELFSKKLRFSSNNALYGHSVGAVASHHEEEPFESLEELEAQTIGDLLPNDDELLSGVVDGLNYTAQPNSGDDMEDLDLFNSIGGMDLGEDGSSSQLRVPDLLGGISNGLGGSGCSIAGEHPFGENPSRTLFVRNINSNVEDSELRALFEQYGDIRTLYTACKHRGFVMISYYDIRAAQNAIKALQNKPLRRRKLDIHYSIPKIRETPHRSRHKFVEFYDLRASEYALHALNSSDIAGKRIKLEPSRPGGVRRVMLPFASELEQDEFSLYLQKSSLPNNLTGFSGTVSNGGSTSCGTDEAFLNMHSAAGATVSPLLNNALHQGISSSVPNSLPSLVRVETVGNTVAESGQSLGQLNFEIQGTSIFFGNGAPCSSPGNISANTNAMVSDKIESRQLCRVNSSGHSFEVNEGVFGHSGNGSYPPGQQYLWSNSHHPQPQNMMWPNSPSLVNGFGSAKPPRLHAVPWAPSHILNTILPLSGHHVGSAPSVNPSLWDRRHVYAGESPDASVFHPGSLGNTRISGNSPQLMEFVPPNIFPQRSGNCMDLPISSQNVGLHSHHQRCIMFPSRGQIIPMMSSFDSPNERSRSRRNEGSSSQTDNKKQFELDMDQIIRGEDKRTTLMIKNIPNKYTSKMLLAAIDERHRGTYDFIYLPIDFKNKCNVGYAFINMIDPSLIISFYQSFNGKKWEKFNSEKVASLAYARIQGKAALIAHFQNSSLMNEDKRCRPILFHTDGPNAGDQVPFPMGVNVRPKPSKTRSSTSDENHQDSTQNPANGEESSNGDSLSGSAKELD